MKQILIVALILSMLVLPAFAACDDQDRFGDCKDCEVLKLYEKDPSTWTIVEDGAYGHMRYTPEATELNFVFKGFLLEPATDYSLIVYSPDSWPGVSSIILGTGTTDELGYVKIKNTIDTGTLEDVKVWLVLSSDIGTTGMTGWNPTEYLFENNLITYTEIV